MDLKKQTFTINFAGQELILEKSIIAEQADAAILGRYGDTAVLVTITTGKEDKKIDYFPLTIDYEEKFYAAGKIIGSRFIRREGRPSEEAILSGRLIDRSLRPLFDKRLRRDIQIVITVLAYDEENDPDFVALIAASTALGISNIPWNGPIGGFKIARTKQGETIINPTNTRLQNNIFAFTGFITGLTQKINMIELAGNEANEQEIIDSLTVAQQEIAKLIAFQKEIVEKIGTPKLIFEETKDNQVMIQEVKSFLESKLEAAIYNSNKTESQQKLSILKQNLQNHLLQKGFSEDELTTIDSIIDTEIDSLIHKKILDEEKRPDGRKLDEIRSLHAEIGLFNRLHGSALFIRGNTQALAVVTLAAPGAEQLIETMETSAKRRFMFHYNFPPYSVGETGRLGGPGRREIGHGALAEKALRPIIPNQNEFPYTIRVVSEILSSNGSSSMASTCAASLALMDAGVPIKKPVAGIAMGLITESINNNEIRYKILTDIQGPEDHHGDMDCKIAGTVDGITAIQIDFKIEGLNVQILNEVFQQAKKARLQILDFMKNIIPEPKNKISPFAPVIMTYNIKTEQIGDIIGPAGKTINNIIATTGVLSIDIEQSGQIFIAANNNEKAQAALEQIKNITKEFQTGEIIEGKVVKILEFGAIVDLGNGKDGMIHISELKNGFVKKVEDVLKTGDLVKAKIIKIENGKISLSLKALNS
jgi:polyribonucleotide nucleotidyltransferase